MTYYWHKNKKPVGHMDDWLMTYADMITLLLCFFVIFLSAAIIKESKPEPQKALVQAVEDAPKRETRAIVLPFPETAFEQDEKPLAEAISTEPIIDVPEAGAPIPESLEAKGDRITSLEMDSAAFFDKGSATISESGKGILRNVAVKLKDNKYNNYQITVEGHTDDSPINTPAFPSNWELSTSRASAVVQFFLGEGIPAQKLRAAGYADTFPKVPNRDANSNPLPENQAQNRRVIIKLEKIDKLT